MEQIQRQKFSRQEFSFFKLLFKNYFLIFFSLLNCTFPLMITIIVAFTTNIGNYIPIYAIISIGTLGSFLIAFYQLGFIFSISLLNILVQAKNDKNNEIKLTKEHIVYYQYLCSLIVGIFLSLLYIAIASLYLFIQTSGDNTEQITQYGRDFIYSSSPTIVLSLINTTIVFNVFNKTGNFKATLIVITQYLVSIFFVCLIGLYTYSTLDTHAFALGIIVADLFNILIIYTISLNLEIKPSYDDFNTDFKMFLKLLYKMFKISLVALFNSMMKILIILIMKYVSGKGIGGTQIPNYLFARLIFLFELYIVGFFISGVVYSLIYLKIKYRDNPEIFFATYRTNWMLCLLVSLVVIISSIIFRFSIDPLFNFYLSNSPNVSDISLEGAKSFITLPKDFSYILVTLGLVISSFSLPSRLSLKRKIASKNHFVNFIKSIWIPSTKWFIIFSSSALLQFAHMNKGYGPIAIGLVLGNLTITLYELGNIISMNKSFKQSYFQYNKKQSLI